MVRDDYKKMFVESPFINDISSFFERKKEGLLNKLLSNKAKEDKEVYEIIGAMKEVRNEISVIKKIIQEVKDAG